ncbi:MAG: HAD family hydrolase [Micromonosporaceae bacterium]
MSRSSRRAIAQTKCVGTSWSSVSSVTPSTPYAREVIRAAKEAGRPVAIVSNNSEPAIRAYLDVHTLTGWIAPIVGRAYATPDRMKPNPAPIVDAMTVLGVDPATCALVGDSVTDIEAARAAGVRSIGDANKVGKTQALTDAGADAVAEGANGMGALAAALRDCPVSGDV